MTDWFSLGVVIEVTRNGKTAKQNGNEMEVRFVVTDAFCALPYPTVSTSSNGICLRTLPCEGIEPLDPRAVLLRFP